MFRNLEAELKRKNLTRSDLADYLGLSPSTISLKMNRRNEFTLKEAFAIKDNFFPEAEFEYLFEAKTTA